MNDNQSKLNKYLSPLNAWALAFGCSVGWGAFVMPGTTFLPLAGPLGTALGMFLGALLMIIIGMNYHFMMNRYQNSGGTFAYTKEIFGYDHGFLSAWFLILVYVAIMWANATALAILCRKLLGDLFQFGFHYTIAEYDVYLGEISLSIIALISLGLLCIYRKPTAANLQTIMSIALIIGVVICFAGVIINNSEGSNAFKPLFSAKNSDTLQILNIVALAPWAFIGFESISNSVPEFNFSPTKSLIIMVVAILAGFVSYTLLSEIAVLAYLPDYYNWRFYISDLDYLSGLSSLPTASATFNAMGKFGLSVLSLAILCGILTAIIGNYTVASRILYSLSKDDILPKWFGKLNNDGAPKNAILFLMVISIFVPLLGRTAIGWIVDVTSVCAVIAYGYTSAAAYVTAKAENNLKVRCSGAMGLLISLMFGLLLIVPNLLSVSTMAAESYLIMVVWGILGFVYFRTMFKHDEARKFGKSVIVWIVMLFLIFFGTVMWTRQSSNDIMERVVEETSEFYQEEMIKNGVKRNVHRQQKAEAFLEQEMDSVRSSIFQHSLIQLTLIMISLTVMFNVYSIMQKREKQAEVDKLSAEESSRAKTTFLSNMSHDIRTPMNAIVGYIELSKRERSKCDTCDKCGQCADCVPEHLADFLNKIDSSSKHLLALINDVLEMSRIESGKMELEPVKTNLVETLEEVHDMFATQMDTKKIIFTVDSSEVKHRNVLCDKNRLNRVLLNLLSNAYKFTPEGGAVSVKLTQLDEIDDRGKYELRVKDSGIGMSPEFAAKVFEEFEREKTSTVSGIQGTGLGMAITKNIIDLMGGDIKVETVQGKGTEFIIRLEFELHPEDEIIEEVAQEITEQEQKSDDKPKKLLLVEDIEVNREIATMILMQAGFEVDTATNGQEAVDKVSKASKLIKKVAASKPGEYDLILMDIQMPIMNGYEATKEIRKLNNPQLASIPIIAMTANAFSEDIQNAKAAGMNDHIAKPLDVPKMMKILSKFLS